MKGFHEAVSNRMVAGRQLAIFENTAAADEHRRVPFHWHECLELLVLEQGHCALSLEQQQIDLLAGDLVLIGAGSSHGIPDMCGCRFSVMQFAPEWLLDLDGAITVDLIPFIQADANCLAYARLSSDAPVRTWLADIAADLRDCPPAQSLSIRGSLLKIFAWLIRAGHMQYPAEGRPAQWLSQLQPALKYVQEHFREAIDETYVASLCHVSRHHFCRIFSKATGKRFVSYIHHVRMLEARRRLATTHQPISLIATDIGYSSPSHFAAIFRKMTGMTPLNYRRQNRDRSSPNHDI